MHVRLYMISERRGETRSEVSRRSTQKASFYSHLGKQNNIITREIVNKAKLIILQKVILFRCRTDTGDESAQPESAQPGPARPHRHQK